jgi:hypothetical protein
MKDFSKVRMLLEYAARLNNLVTFGVVLTRHSLVSQMQ